MKKSEYKAYLQSAEWREKRNEAFDYHGSFCNRCDLPRWVAELVYDQDLHVHHVSYATQGNEDLDDLEIVCARCHEIETFGRSELRAPKEAICEACGDKHWDYRSNHCSLCSEIRNDSGSYFARLYQPSVRHGGDPFWVSFVSLLALRHSWGGFTVEQIVDVISGIAKDSVLSHLKSMEEEIPF